MEMMTAGVKQRLSETILTDDDVRFYWCLLSAEIGDAEGEVLLKMIVDLFITVRGFSFAKSVMEMYKQEKKCTHLFRGWFSFSQSVVLAQLPLQLP